MNKRGNTTSRMHEQGVRRKVPKSGSILTARSYCSPGSHRNSGIGGPSCSALQPHSYDPGQSSAQHPLWWPLVRRVRVTSREKTCTNQICEIAGIFTPCEHTVQKAASETLYSAKHLQSMLI